MSLTAQVLTDARIYFSSCDLTGFGNQIELAPSATDLDVTNFASGGWMQRAGGLSDTQVAMGGFWEAGDLSQPDDTWWANLGKASVPLSAAPTSGGDGTLIYLTQGVTQEYKPGAKIGDPLAWAATVKGNKPLVRGTVLHPQGTPRTATGNGAGRQLGAVSAAQRLWCNYHMFSLSGGTGTLTITVQSSPDNTFASPTTQITFTASSGMDAQAASALGAITDTWFRIVYTISVSTGSPSWLFNVSAGVGPKA